MESTGFLTRLFKRLVSTSAIPLGGVISVAEAVSVKVSVTGNNRQAITATKADTRLPTMYKMIINFKLVF